MQNFIEVVYFKDQSVIEGIVHGIWHRTTKAVEDEQLKPEFQKANILGYIDVTQKAAEASLFQILRRELPSQIMVPMGIHHTHVLRGRTLMRPTFIFSDNLNVLAVADLTSALRQFITARYHCTHTYATQTRFIVPESLSERFRDCIEEAYFLNATDAPREGWGLFHNEHGLEPTVSLDVLISSFVTGKPDPALNKLASLVIDPEHEKFISDMLISKICGWCKVNHKPLYISTNRYRKYIMADVIAISEAVV